MNYAIKKVKTELPLMITVEFEDGTIKGMWLLDIIEQKPELKKLKDSPVVFLKPIIGESKDIIEWWSNGDVISIDASLIYEKGQELSERDAERHLRYVEMSDEYQCSAIPTYTNYIFNTPFTIRVANYINLPETVDSLSAKEEYQKLLKRYPHIMDVGTYQDVRYTYYPHSLDSPQLVKLLEDCAAGKIDVVYTGSICSFANTITASLTIAQQLYDIGVMVYFQREDFLSDSFAFDTFTHLYREIMTERSLPQICLGAETVLRVLDPEKKNPFGEAEKYMSYPYHIYADMDQQGNCRAEIRELPLCVGHGKTPEEAIDDVKKRQLKCIYQLLLEGKEVPPPAEMKES